MKCINHPAEQWAVAQCDACRKGLCPQCASQWVPPLCSPCALHHFTQQKQNAVRELLYLAVAFLLGGYFLVSAISDAKVVTHRYFYFLLGGVILAGALAGWCLISQRLRATFVWVSREGVPLDLAFRIIISALVGPFLLPFALYGNLKKYRDARQAERRLTSVVQ